MDDPDPGLELDSYCQGERIHLQLLQTKPKKNTEDTEKEISVTVMDGKTSVVSFKSVGHESYSIILRLLIYMI